MLINLIKRAYSIKYGHSVEVVCYKRQVGILLHGEFVLFLSRSYIKRCYGVDVSHKIHSSIPITKDEIIKLVKQERATRVKLSGL